jgi:hypothetical protein
MAFGVKLKNGTRQTIARFAGSAIILKKLLVSLSHAEMRANSISLRSQYESLPFAGFVASRIATASAALKKRIIII